jgi:hypothetical protein
MYSPKISEDLIPILYRTAKARRIPMTKLVDLLIRAALAAETHSEETAPISGEVTSHTTQAAA